MAAGNETNKFVRDGSMLPHHDIDTASTPNSWRPKTDVENLATNPIKIDQSGGAIKIDYDLSNTPDTSSAPDRDYKQVVEGSDGKEYLLRSGNGYRENHDGTITLWGSFFVDNLNTANTLTLPVALDGPLSITNTIVSLHDYAYIGYADGTVIDLVSRQRASTDLVSGTSDINVGADISIMAIADVADDVSPSTIHFTITTTLGLA